MQEKILNIELQLEKRNKLAYPASQPQHRITMLRKTPESRKETKRGTQKDKPRVPSRLRETGCTRSRRHVAYTDEARITVELTGNLLLSLSRNRYIPG